MNPDLAGIATGALVVHNETLTPESVVLSREPLWRKWGHVTNHTPRTLTAGINEAGWTFFFIARSLQSSVWAFNDQGAVLKSMQNLIGDMDTAGLNCLEVETVRRYRFLGLPRLSITARCRHIQAAPRLMKRSQAQARA